MLVSHDRGQIERLAHARLLLPKTTNGASSGRACRMSYVPLTPLDLAWRPRCSSSTAPSPGTSACSSSAASPSPPCAWCVQLALVGFVLKLIFAQTSPVWTVLMGLVMVIAAGVEVTSRQHRRIAGWHVFGLSTATLLVHRHGDHRARRRRHHRARSLVRAALHAADPRHGARQHHDRHEPRARHADRDRAPRARRHRGAARARRPPLRGHARRAATSPCAPA